MPEFYLNPYPTYHQLQAEDPVHLSSMGAWVITGYADVAKALRDPRLSSKPSEISSYSQRQEGSSLVASFISDILFFRDPPDHTRLRRLIGKVFNTRIVEEMRPRIQEIVNELINRIEEKGDLDMIADFAKPLPVAVISHILGIPPEDRYKLKQWSHWLGYIFDPMKASDVSQQLTQSIVEFREYLTQLIAKRRQKPEQDLITALIQARDEHDKLSEEELLVTCMLLFASGEETTVNLIGNGVTSLLRHPDQLAKLRQNPSLIQSAVEEFLRYESPLQISGRTAIEDIKIGGKLIKKGPPVFLILGAANRDPAQFHNPDQLDITRTDNNHFAFGDGIHYCMGSALARTQGQIAINALVQKLPNLQLQTNKLEWRENVFLRGLKTLPVSFGN
ncbi:cytochrome P450 [Halotia wernerae UHCC 0503]|nr:cytochrome P450 [Halotia wernerae UHCC 0503]